jgi:antitoxin FitA
MAAVTIRNLPDETHRALKQRAASHGRSTEAEIRAILEEAVSPDNRLKIGTAIAARAREFGGVDLNIKRDQTPVDPAVFE